MRVVDANVLLYAVNTDTEHHVASREWLDRALGGADTVGLSWLALLAFLRLSTKPGLFPRPLPCAKAMVQIREWTAAPGAVVIHPGPDHADHLSRLLTRAGSAGNLVNDAHLAALAVAARGEVVSYDNDFARFTGLTWHRPDDLIP